MAVTKKHGLIDFDLAYAYECLARSHAALKNRDECKKWYSETTGTPLYEIKLKNKWQSYLKCMEKGMSIKKIAKELNDKLKLNVSL